MNIFHKIALPVMALVVLVGCSHINRPKTESPTATLPKFQLLDSEGAKVESQQFADKRAMIILFDVESVFAWRRLAEFARFCAAEDSQPVKCFAIGGTKSASNIETDINSLKRQYEISFPIVSDFKSALPKVFSTPSCCDYVLLYDAQGNLKHLSSLHSEPSNVLSLFAKDKPLRSENPGNLTRVPSSEFSRTLQIKTTSGKNGTFAFSKSGFTVVNLFDQFCTECATGHRLETLNRLARAQRRNLQIAVVFSEKNFSPQDVKNFSSMLKTEYPLYQGDLGTAANAMISGRLLLVFDGRGAVVWQEKPDMSEEEILQAVVRLEGSDPQIGETKK